MVNLALHWRAWQAPHVPVMRVFQSVSLLSKRHEMPPDFSISAQWVFVVALMATLQLCGMGTSHCLPPAPFLMFPIWHELDVWVSRPSGWASADTVTPMASRTRPVRRRRACRMTMMLAGSKWVAQRRSACGFRSCEVLAEQRSNGRYGRLPLCRTRPPRSRRDAPLPMTKRDIAAVLEEIAFLLELKGENPFKVKAYATGARVIESLPEEPAVLVQKGLLRNVKGIGQTLEGTVAELVTTGRSTLHQELLAAFPASLLEMAVIPGLGPKKIKAIYDQLGISSVGELEYACIENRLVGLQGFGQKTQEKILAGIRQYKRRQGFHLYANVIEEAESILAAVRGAPGVVRADHAGEIRRRCEVVQNIMLVVAGGQPQALIDALRGVPEVTQVEYLPETRTLAARSPQGLPVSIKLTEAAAYGWELLRATGNREHVEALTQRLQARGVVPRGETEEAIYAAAGLPFIPPELREGHGEIELAESGRLPVLLDPGQIQGVFHTHTIYSDGSATLEQMVETTRSLGYRYIGISDHSQSAFYANGLKEDRVRAQHAEIAAVQKKFPASGSSRV